MKKSFLTAALTLAIFLILSPVTVAEAGNPLPHSIGVATGGVGTTGHAIAVAYGGIMEEVLGRKVRVLPSAADIVNFGQIKAGRALFIGGAVSQNCSAMDGTDNFAVREWGPQECAFMWYSNTTPYGLLVRGDSDIKTVKDVKGKKVAVYKASMSWHKSMGAILNFGGLSWDDVQQVEVGSYSQIHQAVADGRADCTYSSPISSITHEIAQNPNGIRYVPMPLEDKEGWDRFFTIVTRSDKGYCKKGVEQAKGIPMVMAPFPIFTLKGVSDDAIYEIVKFFAENFNRYEKAHPMIDDMHIDKVLAFKNEGIAMAIHPGTVRYLKEIGKWSEQDEQWNRKQWEQVDRLKEAWNKAIAEADKNGIKIANDNEEWIKLWKKHREAAGDLVRRSS
ncbi:MAG: TAXI family TRAP transporter solute-binding subunit [Syntrophales bacterium]|nr:TAXI family TRAP transporter solute-binding subunit [Syntrophales bacterium]MDY0045110.1 TAXI family TRAP transporter solute-binding subunit [Syntrophales bacterium]